MNRKQRRAAAKRGPASGKTPDPKPLKTKGTRPSDGLP